MPLEVSPTDLNVAYDSVIGQGSLRDSLVSQLSSDYDSQLNVYSEIALLRALAAQAVQEYNKHHEAYCKNPSDPKAFACCQVAAQLMTEALQNVVDACGKGQRINSRTRERFDLNDMKRIMSQIALIVEKHSSPNQARLINNDLKQQVMELESEVGTLLHPDDVAREFDASVPMAPPE